MSISKREIKEVLDELKARAEVQHYVITKENGDYKVVVEPEAGVDANALFMSIIARLPKGDTHVDIIIKNPITKITTSQIREMISKMNYGKKE